MLSVGIMSRHKLWHIKLLPTGLCKCKISSGISQEPLTCRCFLSTIEMSEFWLPCNRCWTVCFQWMLFCASSVSSNEKFDKPSDWRSRQKSQVWFGRSRGKALEPLCFPLILLSSLYSLWLNFSWIFSAKFLSIKVCQTNFGFWVYVDMYMYKVICVFNSY